MKNKTGAALAGALMGLATFSGGSAAQAQTMASLPANSSAAAITGEARPVFGWVDFCRRHPQECAVNTAEAPAIALTPRVWQTIVSTNRKVNVGIQAITDQEHWGVPDRWDLPNDGYGDCEDFQLLKRKLLAEAGFPRRAMRITVVIDEKGEGHAVLMVRTDRGDFVLDNKTSARGTRPATSMSSARARPGSAGCPSAGRPPPWSPRIGEASLGLATARSRSPSLPVRTGFRSGAS